MSLRFPVAISALVVVASQLAPVSIAAPTPPASAARGARSRLAVAPASAPTPATAPQAFAAALTAPSSGLPLLTLDDAVNAALTHQPLVLQAVANERAGEARVGEARAALLPQIVGLVQATYSNPIFAGVILGSVERLAPGISITQTLFDPGAFYRWRAARASVAPLATGVELTDAQVALNVRVAYYNVLAAEALVAVNQEQVQNQQKHLDQIQAFVQVGTRPKIDLVTQQVNLGNAQLALVQAQNGVQQSKVALQIAIGQNGAPLFEVQDSELPPVPGEDASPETLLPDALHARPEIRQLDQQVEAQQLTVTANRVQIFLPTLSVSGQYNYLFNRISQVLNRPTCANPADIPFGAGGNSPGPTYCIAFNTMSGTVGLDGMATLFSFPSTVTTQGNQWQASATLTWPLFIGGLNEKQTEEQEANLDALVAQRDNMVLTVRSDIEAALIAIANDKQQVALGQVTVEQAREQRNLAQGRYDLGVGNIIELGDAEAQVANAEGQLIKAKYSLAADRARLTKALGQ